MDINSLSKAVEKVSAGYTKKFNISRDNNWLVLKLQEELGELTQSYLMLQGQARAKGKTAEQLQDDFHKEIADVFCHVLLLANYNKVNLEKEINEKWLVWNSEQGDNV